MRRRNDAGVTAYIGLGSNLGDSVGLLRTGLAELRQLPATAFETCSSLYASAPIGRADQPDFVNAVCRVQTALTAEALLAQLLTIEARHGRVRAEPGGPRTLDLDLLLFGNVRCRLPGLELPHPRLHERAFVLYPLHEISPDIDIPGHGKIATLLSGCDGQKIEKLTANI